jgi:hypothetical protein
MELLTTYTSNNDDYFDDKVNNKNNAYTKPSWDNSLKEGYMESFDDTVLTELQSELESIIAGKQYLDDAINNLTHQVSDLLTNAATHCDLISTKIVLNVTRKGSTRNS